MKLNIYICIFFVAISLLPGKYVFSQHNFRAAVVKIDITPDNSQQLLGYQARKSTSVHDHIYHRIVAMDDGITPFYLISSDLCIISPDEYDKVAARLQKELGIDPLNVWWTTTHTHSAPEVGPADVSRVFMGERYLHQVDSVYTAMVEQQLVDGVKKAQQQLAPARLGTGWGYAQANINRRARNMNGKSSLGMDPDGPVDRRIGMLRIDKADGSPLATIANYAMHGTVLGGQNMAISGDAPGIVAEYVEKQSGAPMLFINGAAGNIAPLYSGHSMGVLDQFNIMLGDKILDAGKKIITTADIALNVGALTVETPRKKGMEWPANLGKYNRTTKAGVNMVLLPIRFFKINEDVAIWGAPLELFCEISNEIRDLSPFPFTFYYGYSNGWMGYLPTEAEWSREGYEPTVSALTPAAEKDLKEAVVTYLKGEMLQLAPRPKGKKNKR